MKIHEITNNIKNFESHMTIFFNKATGKIVSWATGLHDMSYFFDESLAIIWDYEIYDLDTYVMENPDEFVVQGGELRLVPKPKKQKYAYAEIVEPKEVVKEAVKPTVLAEEPKVETVLPTVITGGIKE